MRVLSLGAGVQSTTLYLMAAAGKFEHKPDVAIFADTQYEPEPVYRHLKHLQSLDTGIPIEIVTHGNIKSDSLENANVGSGFVSLPLYTKNPDTGGDAAMRRQCSREYKITPITKKCRELLGYKPRQRIPKGSIEMWIGISMDEIVRMKPNRERWIDNTWPLIDKRMSRHNCISWLEGQGYVDVPKSACIMCPFHDNAFWREMKMERPEEFADAVGFERDLHAKMLEKKGEVYLHQKMQFLDTIDFRNMEDMGQTNMFGSECEGICGV